MNKTARPKTTSPTETQNKTHLQPARLKNIDAIVSFFESGIKAPDVPGALGIELEHTIVHNNMDPVSYSQTNGVVRILKQLERYYPETTHDPKGDLLGVARPNEAVTIEPASQLELSAGPFRSLDTANETFEAFERTLADVLAPVGEKVLTIGYHPTATAQSLELIPKRRYEFMDSYLSRKSSFGPCMMRGSASTQISIDYYSVPDCLRKLRLAYALTPLLSLICDNTPIFEGKPRTHQLVRTEIWKYCDPDRCGLVPGILETSFNLRDYAEYILDTPAIIMPCSKEDWCYSEDTFGEIYAEATMTRSDVEHATSMFFNDVRLKTYIEIRPADAMPIPYVIAYAALIKGLFYNDENLTALDTLFADITPQAYIDAKESLMAQGYRATVYGRPITEIADQVASLAQGGLTTNELHYLQPLLDLISSRTTLASLSEQEK